MFVTEASFSAVHKCLSLVCLFQKLVILYDKILRTLQRIPEEAAYRKYTEAIVKDRLAMVKTVSIDNFACWTCLKPTSYVDKLKGAEQNFSNTEK